MQKLPELDIGNGHTYIIITVSSQKNAENLQKHMSILHEKEAIAGFRYKSKLYSTIDKDIWVVKGPKQWKDSCWKIMVYTFYIKTLMYNDPKTVDKGYWAALEPHEDKFLKNVKMPPEAEIFTEETINNMHDATGFCSIVRGSNPEMAKLLGIK